MAKSITDAVVAKTIELGRLMFSFGLVQRVTMHEDGATYESDSTHTAMLGVMACAFAAEFVPQLDKGTVAQFALVHDLVEVYAGDTNTFRKLERNLDKEQREAQALARIKKEFDDVYPWVGKTIEEYESLKSPEARFIKTFDKILPKISHYLNQGAAVKKLGHNKEEMREFHLHQLAKLRGSYAADQEETLALLSEVNDTVWRMLFE